MNHSLSTHYDKKYSLSKMDFFKKTLISSSCINSHIKYTTAPITIFKNNALIVGLLISSWDIIKYIIIPLKTNGAPWNRYFLKGRLYRTFKHWYKHTVISETSVPKAAPEACHFGISRKLIIKLTPAPKNAETTYILSNWLGSIYWVRTTLATAKKTQLGNRIWYSSMHSSNPSP